MRLYADSTTVWKSLELNTPELDGLLPHVEALALDWLLGGLGLAVTAISATLALRRRAGLRRPAQ